MMLLRTLGALLIALIFLNAFGLRPDFVTRWIAQLGSDEAFLFASLLISWVMTPVIIYHIDDSRGHSGW